MGPSFRRALARDIPALVALVNGAYGREAVEPGWTSERDLVAGPRTTAGRMAEHVAAGHLLVAEDGGALVGCVLVQPGADREADIGMLSVHPRGQARGVGRALLGHAEAEARDALGARLAVLQVISRRAELIAWYERRGYRRTGRRQPFVSGGPGRAKERALEFERLEKRLI